MILMDMYASPLASHSGFQKTYACARRYFLWASMKKDILTLVIECYIANLKNKGEIVKTPWALHPLPILATIRTDISMNFNVFLPKFGNKSVIMVVVDQLSNYAHFFALQHPFTPTTVTQIFIDLIFKLHGIPTSIVLDHDPTFTNKFWKELFKVQGT